MFDPKNNFFKLWCEPLNDGWHYRSACQGQVTKILADDSLAKQMYPGCVDAIKRGSCKAVRMGEEEFEKGRTIYYVDRDDAGPGIVARQVPRPAKEIAEHHAVLAGLDIAPKAKASNWQVMISRADKKAPEAGAVRTASEARASADDSQNPVNAFDMSAFDLGSMITNDVKKLKEIA